MAFWHQHALDLPQYLVRIGGDIWTARPGRPDMTFEPGEKHVVDWIDGAVAVVDSDNFGEN